MKQAGAAVLALEAGKTLLLEKETLIQVAHAAELCITGVLNRGSRPHPPGKSASGW